MANNLLPIVLISFNILVFVNCVPPKCYICDSAIDDNCKILGPESDVLVKDCATDLDEVPDQNHVCYTLIEGTNVKRNCLIDEPAAFQVDCDPDNNNPFCFACNLDKCNTVEIAPLECITCNSTADPNCATLRQPIATTEQCELVEEHCFVGVADGITYRGCISSAVNNDECPAGMCQKCSNKDKCNDVIYPVDRWSCHQCNEHTDCNGEQEPSYSYPCQNYEPLDSCYTIGMGLYAQRGCISDLDDFQKNCIDNLHLCEICDDATDCNHKNWVNETAESCYFCDQANPYCFAHVNNTPDETAVTTVCKLFSKYEFQCYTYTSDNEIVRDCLNHVERISQPECIENAANCDFCDTKMCNVEPVLEIGDSCITCEFTDPNCYDPDNILSLTKNCYSHPDKKGCYFKFFDEEKRGCITDLEDDMLAECVANNETCKICLGENCNQKLDITTCYQCNSTEDVSCVDFGSYPVICDDYLDTCLVYVKENGFTVRGCTNELNPAADDVVCTSWNCKECQINNCNGEMFPADRLKCLKCASETQSDCFEITETAIATHSVTCPNYVSDDSCFSIVTGNLNITRGCISDGDDAAIQCPDKYCKVCNSRNNCNIRELHYEPSLSCIQCNQTDPKCVWGFVENDAKLCNATIFFDGEELCYTYQKDGIIQRGCVLDDENCLNADEACTTCGSFGCNSLHLTQSRCIVCDSSDIEQEFCDSEIEEGDLTTCLNGNQLYEYRGCYTFKTETHVHRGCVSTLTIDNFDYCKNADYINCDICYGDGCNYQEPNFASRLYYLSALTLLCISLLIKLL